MSKKTVFCSIRDKILYAIGGVPIEKYKWLSTCIQEVSSENNYMRNIINKINSSDGGLSSESWIGEWIEDIDAEWNIFYSCSICGSNLGIHDDKKDFCPYCGSPMNMRAWSILRARIEGTINL